MKSTFYSSRTYGLFTAHFDSELYHYAADCYEKKLFGHFQHLYSLVGVTKVLEDVEISQRNHSPHNDLKRFLEQDFYVVSDDANVIRKFSRYLTARIDIKFLPGKPAGDFKVISISDDNGKIEKPAWFQKQGIGYTITSYQGNLEVVAKAGVEGQIQLFLRGMDVRDPEDKTKKIPYWIDYTALTVNDNVIFDKITPAWHDKPYRYNFNVKANEEIKIKVEWQPHRSDT